MILCATHLLPPLHVKQGILLLPSQIASKSRLCYACIPRTPRLHAESACHTHVSTQQQKCPEGRLGKGRVHKGMPASSHGHVPLPENVQQTNATGVRTPCRSTPVSLLALFFYSFRWRRRKRLPPLSAACQRSPFGDACFVEGRHAACRLRSERSRATETYLHGSRRVITYSHFSYAIPHTAPSSTAR